MHSRRFMIQRVGRCLSCDSGSTRCVYFVACVFHTPLSLQVWRIYDGAPCSIFPPPPRMVWVREGLGGLPFPPPPTPCGMGLGWARRSGPPSTPYGVGLEGFGDLGSHPPPACMGPPPQGPLAHMEQRAQNSPNQQTQGETNKHLRRTTTDPQIP